MLKDFSDFSVCEKFTGLVYREVYVNPMYTRDVATNPRACIKLIGSSLKQPQQSNVTWICALINAQT